MGSFLILSFFIAWPVSAKRTPSESVTETCAHSVHTIHTVSENPYKSLLARLRGGDSRPAKSKKKRRRGGGRGKR